MIQQILDKPWIALTLVAIIAFLWVAAARRVRRERMRNSRTLSDLRDKLIADWEERRTPRN